MGLPATNLPERFAENLRRVPKRASRGQERAYGGAVRKTEHQSRVPHQGTSRCHRTRRRGLDLRPPPTSNGLTSPSQDSDSVRVHDDDTPSARLDRVDACVPPCATRQQLGDSIRAAVVERDDGQEDEEDEGKDDKDSQRHTPSTRRLELVACRSYQGSLRSRAHLRDRALTAACECVWGKM